MKKQFNYIVTLDGKIPPDIAQEIKQIHLDNIGKQIRLGITNERKRSLSQNNWLHHVIKLISDFLRAQAKEQGNENYYLIDEEYTKRWIKEKFLGFEEVDGEKYLRHTSNLKTFECNELFQNLQVYFAPFNLYIPDPNEQTKE